MKELDQIDGLLKTVSDGADALTTTDEEERALVGAVHSADMKSDSWLSKNIRPLFMIGTFTGVIVFSLMDSYGKHVPDETYEILKLWGEFAISFYFGTRGVTHIMRERKKTEIVKAKISRKEARVENKQLNKEERRGLLKKILGIDDE